MLGFIKELMYGPVPVSVIFTLIGLSIIVIAVRTRHKKKPIVVFDEVLLGVFHILLVFYYPLFFNRFINASALFLFSNLFVIISLFVISLIVLYEVFRVHRHKDLRKQKSYACFKSFFRLNEQRNRFRRRLTHMIPILVILPIYAIFQLFSLPSSWCIGFIIFFGLAFIVFFSIGDIVRLLRIHLLPDWAWDFFAKGLNEREVESNTFTTTSAMVLGLSPWILTGFTIFFIVVLVTSVSDAIVALVGYRFGRVRMPRKSKKTVAGYLAGIFITLWMAITTFLILEQFSVLTVLNMSAVIAMTFFVVDFLNLPIDDNKINPHVIGLVTLLLLAPL